MREKISGVVAAVPTAFDESFNPIIELFLEQCEWAFANGCDGLNVLGSTGEANSQERNSRVSVMRAIAKSDCGRRPLMVGTGTPSLRDTQYLTKLAAELRFDAALILPPYFYKPLSNDGLFNYFSSVIEPVSKSDIGIYLYNFPQMTGISLTRELVGRLLEAYPHHLKGMKDSSGDMNYSRSMAKEFPDILDVLPGSETCLAEAKVHGYAGCISASVNATAPLASRVWRARGAASSDDIQDLARLRAEISGVPMVAAVKTLVALRTGRDEWLRMMPPLIALGKAERQKINQVAGQLAY